ncbi:MAG: HupE/UreJ family protein [Pseudomonadota bacterium]
MSTIILLLSLLPIWSIANAHEVRPAIADVSVSADMVTLRVTLNAEALLAGIDLDGLADTNEAANVADYDALRALSDEQLAARVTRRWSDVDANISLQVGFTDLVLTLQSAEVVPEPNPELPRDTIVTAMATMAEGETPITIGWAREYGTLIVREMADGVDEDQLYTALLTGGAISQPIERRNLMSASNARNMTFLALEGGFQRLFRVDVTPQFLLFALAIFLFSARWRLLFWQIGAMTVGHLAALSVAMTGLFTIPNTQFLQIAAIFVIVAAVQNIVASGQRLVRLLTVFLFALISGVGLASALVEGGTAGTELALQTFSYNLGVEMSQLVVFAIAYLLVGIMFGDRPWYRKFIIVPASAIIAVTAALWLFQNNLFA